MFASIFFHEDSTLSVVGHDSKQLELQGHFRERELVRMKWGKSMFTGTIVKVHEDKEMLYEETVKAEKKIRGKKHTVDDSVDKLIDCFNKAFNQDAAKSSKKRERVETERSKESRRQDQDMSPKKKKSEKECETAEDGGPKKKNENNESEKEKKKIPCKPKKKRDDIVSKETPKTKEREEKKLENTAQIAACKEMLTSNLAQQFEKPNVQEHTEPSSLTKTWGLCTQVTNLDHDQPEVEMNDSLPSRSKLEMEAPAEVIELFRLMLKPSVQSYMRKMVQNSQLSQSHFHETVPVEPTSYLTLLNGNDRGPEPLEKPQQWTTECNYTQPSPWSSNDNQQQILNYHHQETLLAAVDDQSLTSPHNQLPNYQQLQQADTNYQPTFQLATCHSMQPATQDLNFQHSTKEHQHPTEDISQSPSHHQQYNKDSLTPLHTPKRTSPRKHTHIAAPTPSSSVGSPKENMTLLLAHRTLKVATGVLWKAKTAAKNAKTNRMGYVLTTKLLPGVFSLDELANSRGQGLKSKEGDTRPTLDSSKMSDLREYVTAFCNKNGGEVTDRDINDAVTEQVSYARKKIKTKVKEIKQK